MVARRDIDPKEETAFFEALSSMGQDVRGNEILRAMQLDGFVRGSVSLYDSIETMMQADAQFRERKSAGRG